MSKKESILFEALIRVACIKDDPYGIVRHLRMPAARAAIWLSAQCSELGASLVRNVRWIAPEFCTDPRCPNHVYEGGIRCNKIPDGDLGCNGEADGE